MLLRFMRAPPSASPWSVPSTGDVRPRAGVGRGVRACLRVLVAAAAAEPATRLWCGANRRRIERAVRALLALGADHVANRDVAQPGVRLAGDAVGRRAADMNRDAAAAQRLDGDRVGGLRGDLADDARQDDLDGLDAEAAVGVASLAEADPVASLDVTERDGVPAL